MKKSPSDETWMKQALHEAQKAYEKAEAPIGAVALMGGKIIARAHNLRENKNDPLGHAEILLIHKVSKKLKRWRLSGITVFVTLEPCLMCMGALMQARVDRLVFGTFDPKAGARGSRMEVASGVLQEECSKLLKSFFKSLRKKNS